MGWLRRVATAFGGRKRQREVDEELAFHLEMREERNRAAGMGAEEARRAARLRFGNPAVWRERVREVDVMLLPQTVAQDLRFGARILLRRPGFTAVAVFALAVGIGVNTAGYTGYRTFFGRGVQARDAGRMVNLSLRERTGAYQAAFSYPDYEAYRDHVHAFSGVIATGMPGLLRVSAKGGVALRRAGGGGSLLGALGLFPGVQNYEKALTLGVSDNYFQVLGAKAVRGRTFRSGDRAELAASPAVLISANYWKERFDSDPGIIGKTIRLDGIAFTIMGVTPRNFEGTFIAVPDVWIPLRLEALLHPREELLRDRGRFCCHVFGRLAAGATAAEAAAEMTVVANELRPLHSPRSPLSQPLTAVLWPGSPFSVPLLVNPGVRISMFFVMLALGMVLLVACANVAGLQLARTAARQDELAMRMSLGASRGRLIRQLLTESALMALAAGVLAFLMSWVVLREGARLAAGAFPQQFETWVFHVRPDPAVFAFVFGVSMLASVLFGLAPALESSRSAVSSALKANAAIAPRRGRRLRSLLIATQVALCAVLLIVGGMLVHSAIRVLHMKTGYDDGRVMELKLQFPQTAEYTPAHEASLVRQLRTRLTATPGVQEVTSGRAPDDGDFEAARVALNGAAPTRRNARGFFYYAWVDPNYFRTLGIPLLSGEGFAAQSGAAEGEAILSQAAAERLWPGKNAVGRTLRLGTQGFENGAGKPTPDGRTWRVIGVARNTRGVLFDGSDSAKVYLPLPDADVQDYPILVRMRSNPLGQMNAVGAAVAAVDPNVGVEATTLRQMLKTTGPFMASAVAAAIASTTGLLGLLLAAIGIYGIVSYVVVLRTREVGIRMALGAKKRDVLLLILRESARPVVIGLAVGVVAAGGVAWLLRHLLYGLHGVDGAAFAGVSVLLLGIALAAAAVPARRAMRVEPMEALRYE